MIGCIVFADDVGDEHFEVENRVAKINEMIG